MKQLTLYIIFFLVYNLNAQSNSVVILDSSTLKPIPFVSINFLNGFGIYTDDKGRADVTNDILKVEISHVDYLTSTIILNNNPTTIYLKKNVIELSEVVIEAKSTKKRIQRSKPKIGDKDNERAGLGSYGFEAAFYINNKDSNNSNSYLHALSIPICIDNMLMGNQQTKNVSNVLIKLTCYSTISNLPSERIYDFEQFFTLGPDKIKSGIFNLKLVNDLKIPEEGFFIVITLIGKLDKRGDLFVEYPYVEKQIDFNTVKILKSQPYAIPLLSSNNGVPTFIRNFFNKTGVWFAISPPVVRPKEFYFMTEKEKEEYVFEEKNKQKEYTVGIGYEIIIYQ